MNHFFQKQVDRRSRNAMVEFLSKHFRYSTMNSWNGMSSYANCVKVNRLGLTSDQVDGAFALMSADEDYWDELNWHIAEFTTRQNHAYTMGTNGRSGGYLVLYGSYLEDTGYKSRCKSCGQLNYKKVATMPQDPGELVIAQEVLKSGSCWTDATYLAQESIAALPMVEDHKLALIRRFRVELKDSTLGNRCGACGKEGEAGRINLAKPMTRLQVESRGIDQERDFTDWSMTDLRDRVDLVVDFDRTCDEIRESFIEMATSCRVVEETVMVPKTIRRIVCAHAD